MLFSSDLLAFHSKEESVRPRKASCLLFPPVNPHYLCFLFYSIKNKFDYSSRDGFMVASTCSLVENFVSFYDLQQALDRQIIYKYAGKTYIHITK